MQCWSAFDWKGCTRITLAALWYASIMYWLPIIARIGKRSKSSVNKVAMCTSWKIKVSVGAMRALTSSVDGSRLLLAFAARSTLAAVAHHVDWRPFCVCVKCPSTVGVALVGQYRATFLALRPRNGRKLPALTAWRNVDLTREPTVQCRYSMRFLVDGKS